MRDRASPHRARAGTLGAPATLHMVHQIHGRMARPNVLITGASSGIGKATARVFAEEGFRVLPQRLFDHLLRRGFGLMKEESQ